jgi:type II secretory pathway pseudopilin PulG
VLAAMVIMAIVIPVAIEGLRIGSRAGVVAQRKGVAVQLADGLLNELVVTGQWQDSAQSGDFGDRHDGYRWRLVNETWGKDSMRLITIEVLYEVQSQEYSVLLSTLMPPVN